MSQMAPSSPPPQPDSPQPELPQSPAAPPGSKMGVLPVPGFLKGKTKMMAMVLAISGIVSVVGSALWIWHVIKPPQVGDEYTNVHISAVDFKWMCAFTVVISWLGVSFAVAGMLLKERWVYRTYVFLAIYQSILMLVLMFAFVFVAAAAGGSLGRSYYEWPDTYDLADGVVLQGHDQMFLCKNVDQYHRSLVSNKVIDPWFKCCFENPTNHIYCYSSTQKAIIDYYKALYVYQPCNEHDYYDFEHGGYDKNKYTSCQISNEVDVNEYYRKFALGTGIVMVLFSFFSIVCKLLTAFLASVVARSLGPTALVATNSVSYPS